MQQQSAHSKQATLLPFPASAALNSSSNLDQFDTNYTPYATHSGLSSSRGVCAPAQPQQPIGFPAPSSSYSPP